MKLICTNQKKWGINANWWTNEYKQLIAVEHIAIHTWESTYEVHLKPLKSIRHSNGLYMNIYVYVKVYEKICFMYFKL
jgi:hypothetical protein